MSPTEILDLTHLRTFVAVVQEGHLTRAAERLHISQPTASNHIRALESQLDVQLFHRTTRGLEPTPSGTRLADAARRLLGISLELTSLARELRGVPSGHLSIGTVADQRLLERLPGLVLWLQEQQPLLNLNIETRHSLSTRQGLRAGELDAGFFVAAVLEDDMDGFALTPLDYVVAGPAAWKDRLPSADWRDLAGMPWIVTPKGTSNAELCNQFFHPRGLQVKVALETNNDALMRSMIAGGVGVGFVRREFAEEGEANGLFCTAPRTACSTRLLFGYAKARAADPLLRLLISGLRRVWFGEDRTPDEAAAQVREGALRQR
ncbi:MAG TPA: LysR family transcriptional regulator [Ramlibacter sp.]|nr:LysR family transcriptional regulator [Ramlibacter sp.]